MTAGIHRAAAEGFEVGADAYERGRPDYSHDAVARLVAETKLAPGNGKTVVDLGAGTGKFTKRLAGQTLATILAVEPVEGMRAKFSSLLPKIEIVGGTAEAMPFPDSSADAVIVAQAFHWFDGARAIQEIHRVLKPNGVLALIWNLRDESKEWVKGLTGVIDAHEGDAPRYRTGRWRAPFESTCLFTPLESASYHHEHPGTSETVVDRVASISFISALPEAAKQKVLKEVRTLLESDSETQGATSVPFPYITHVFWCRRIG